jgi:hypothetical protein
VNNIKMDFRDIILVCVDRIDLVQDRDHWRSLVNTVMNLRVSYNAGKLLSSYTIGGFSRRAQFHEFS